MLKKHNQCGPANLYPVRSPTPWVSPAPRSGNAALAPHGWSWEHVEPPTADGWRSVWGRPTLSWGKGAMDWWSINYQRWEFTDKNWRFRAGKSNSMVGFWRSKCELPPPGTGINMDKLGVKLTPYLQWFKIALGNSSLMDNLPLKKKYDVPVRKLTFP